MEEVLRHARRLGEAITADPTYRELRAAQREVKNDPEASRLLQVYGAFQRKRKAREHAGKSLTDQERKELDALEERVRKNDLLQQYMRRRADFAELLNKVYQALEQAIEEPQM